MNISKIPTGKNPPYEVNAIIEVARGYPPVKYEMDKDSGALMVDRFLSTAMHYPCDYGFIPHTLSGDGDPVDVLVVSTYPIVAGAVVPVRPIGVLLMEDEAGQDEKILTLPLPKIDPAYAAVQSYQELPEILLRQIAHFFERYKDLEKGKWVKVRGWENAEKAAALIEEGIRNVEGKGAKAAKG